MNCSEYITAALTRPFAWGEHDCVTFASGWVRQATGMDCTAGLRAWRSAREARLAIKQAGGLDSALDARFPRIQPHFARDGDIAMVKGCVLLFSGPHIVGPSHAGMARLPRDRAELAWRVCRG